MMHMADALVAPAVAGTMYLCSSASTGWSIHKIKLENDSKKIPLMGVMGAFVFTAQMINFTIPGTGSSGHLCGGMLLSAILGPYMGFLTMASVLLIQCLLFADGGILALGCNIWNMAFYGCFIGALVIWKTIMKTSISKRKIIVASIIGCIITLQLSAFSVTLETLASGVTELPFKTFLTFMQPIHLAIGLVEGLITGAVLCFIYETRSELLWGIGNQKKENKFSLKKTIGIMMTVTVVIGGGLSLAASPFPDGLEWSIEKMTGNTELKEKNGIYEASSTLQNKTAILPEYSLKNSEKPLGTSVSGIIGGCVVVVFCTGSCYLFKFLQRKRIHE